MFFYFTENTLLVLEIYYNFSNFPSSCPTLELFLDSGPYHIKTSPLICKANQRTGFSIIGISVKNS